MSLSISLWICYLCTPTSLKLQTPYGGYRYNFVWYMTGVGYVAVAVASEAVLRPQIEAKVTNIVIFGKQDDQLVSN